MTANMKIIIHKTKVKLPKAPTVRPIMDISKFSVGHDLANLKTRSWNLYLGVCVSLEIKFKKRGNKKNIILIFLVLEILIFLGTCASKVL